MNLPRSFILLNFHLILQHKFESSGVCSIEEATQLGSGCGIKESECIRILSQALGNNIVLLRGHRATGNSDLRSQHSFSMHNRKIIMESFAGTRSYASNAELVRQTCEISSEVIEEFQHILGQRGQFSKHTM